MDLIITEEKKNRKTTANIANFVLAKSLPHGAAEETSHEDSGNTDQKSHFVHNEKGEDLVLAADEAKSERIAFSVNGEDAEAREVEH